MDEEHLIEREPFLCDEGFLFHFREMDIGEGVREGGEVETTEHFFRNEIRNIVDMLLQDIADLPTEKFRSESGGFRINGNEAARMGLIPFRALEGGIGEEESLFVGSDFAGDADLHARLYHLRDEFLIEPDDADGSGCIGDGRFGEQHFFMKGATGFEGRDDAADGRPVIRREVTDVLRQGIVFVAIWEMKEEIAHADNTEFFQSDEIVGGDGGNGGEGSIWNHRNSIASHFFGIP